MKNEKNGQILSVVLKLLVAVFAFWGFFKCLFSSGFMGGSTLMLYFTMQSNIWIALVGIIIAAVQIVNIKKGEYVLSERLCKLQQVFTVSITLTGFVFCFVLVPSFMAQSDVGMGIILAPEQLFLHVLTPLLAAVDFVFLTRRSLKKSACLWAALPPLYYLGFSAIGYFKNWDFGGGNNYPYFFLNYGSPAGVFGFSNEMPYFMGAFYWIVALVFFVLGVSLLYITIVNRRMKKRNTSKYFLNIKADTVIFSTVPAFACVQFKKGLTVS